MGDFRILSLQDSSFAITVYPTFDYREGQTAIRTRHRTLGGVQQVYDWGRAFHRFEVPLVFVNSGEAYRMNEWWERNQVVAFTLDHSLDQRTIDCRIVNESIPFGTFMRPYRTEYRGVLILEATDTSSWQRRPFTLDDTLDGLLNKAYNAMR